VDSGGGQAKRAYAALATSYSSAQEFARSPEPKAHGRRPLVEMPRDSEQILTEWLVLHAQSGSAEALEQLLKLWYPKLLRYAGRRTRDGDAAKDVVQEALLAATRRIGRLDDPAAFPKWLYRILERRLVDHLRTQIRRRRGIAGYDADNSGAAAPTPGTALEDALASLAMESYQVVHLHYSVGLSVKEIASLIRVPEGTVKSRLHSARAQLRNLLTE
jgi:RNA polymerase sigma-70 factor (ECF subfamily)